MIRLLIANSLNFGLIIHEEKKTYLESERECLQHKFSQVAVELVGLNWDLLHNAPIK